MLLTLTIIFGVGSVAGSFFFWRERKSRMIYERSYRHLSAEIPELRQRSTELMRSINRVPTTGLKIAAALLIFGIALNIAMRRRKSENE